MNFLDFLPEPQIVRIVRGGDGLEGLGQILGLVEQAGKVPLRRLHVADDFPGEPHPLAGTPVVLLAGALNSRTSSTSTSSPALMPAAVRIAFLTGSTYEWLLLSGNTDVDQLFPAIEAVAFTEPKPLRKGADSSLISSAISGGSVMKCQPDASG